MMNRESLVALIRSKARVSGHDSWEGGYYHLSNAEEIADAILATAASTVKPPPLPPVCNWCEGKGRKKYRITEHGDRDRIIDDKCHHCNGTGHRPIRDVVEMVLKVNRWTDERPDKWQQYAIDVGRQVETALTPGSVVERTGRSVADGMNLTVPTVSNL
jgi:hypothetical protein